MKALIGLTLILFADPCVAWQATFPRLTRLNHTYELVGIELAITTDKFVDLQSVTIQRGKSRMNVPAVELEDIDQPHLEDALVSIEGGLTVVEIPYGLAIEGIQGWYKTVSFRFKGGKYVGRTRKVPTSQETKATEVVTGFQYFSKKPGEAEAKGGTGSTNAFPP